MTVVLALAVPMVASVLLGISGPRVARRSTGWVALRLLPATCLLVAGATLVSLAGFAVVVLARIDLVATLGRLSVRALPASFRAVPIPAGLAVGVVAAGLGAAALVQAVRLGRDLVETRRTCRPLRVRADGVYVLDDARPRAFAVVGLRGRIVVSTGMLATLEPSEREAVLAHERAHLRRRHQLSLIAVRLAAAADPLLRGVVPAVGYAVEREADEDAAAALGSRRVVGIALARAGLAVAADARTRAGRTPLLAMSDGDVPRRVAALLGPPARVQRWAGIPLVALGLLAGLMTATDGMSADHHIDHARAVFAAAPTRPVAGTDRPPADL